MDSKKYYLAAAGVLSVATTGVIVKLISDRKVKILTGDKFSFRGKEWSVYGNLNKVYSDSNSFVKLVQNDNNWFRTFCSPDAGVCVIMNDDQYYRARYLQAVRSWIDNKTGKKHRTTSGIRNDEIVAAINKTGALVSKTTDHSYGSSYYPAGQGAIDISIPHGNAGLKSYQALTTAMQNGTIDKIYQAIYYPGLHFVHIGYLGNRNIPADSKRFLYATKVNGGYSYGQSKGKYIA